MSREEKLLQIKKEAKATVIGLFLIIAFWIVSGLGISRLDITVFHTPLWVITGCIGTWVFAIWLVSFVVRHVFKDFELDEEESHE